MRGITWREEVKNPLILIVDDHDQVRTLLQQLISQNFPECSFLEAKTGEEAIVLAIAQRPDIVLMDVRLNGINGTEATRQIKTALPPTSVVIVSIYDYSEYQRDAQAAGACAYILKTRVRTELIPALNALIKE